MKKIEGFPNYFLTEDGDVISFKKDKGINWRKLKPGILNNGYLFVHLCKNGKHFNKTIHRLVALTFVPNPEYKSCVNHIDGNKLNNHYTNLEWVTASENSKHAWNNNLNKGFLNHKHSKESNRKNSESHKRIRHALLVK